MAEANTQEDAGRTLQILKDAAELKEIGIITEEDFERIEERALGHIERSWITSSIEIDSKDQDSSVRESKITIYSGDLHRTIAKQIARTYPIEQTQAREYLTGLVAKLLELKAFAASDMSHITKLIDIVCDDRFGTNDNRMMEGVAMVTDVYDDIRLSPNTSNLAKAIAEIAHDSAQNVVLGRIIKEKEEPVGTGTADTQIPESRRHTFWGTVKEDVTGALSGAGAIGTVMATPGFSVAWFGGLSVLGPPAAVAPILGAVVGAGLISGIEWARQR